MTIANLTKFALFFDAAAGVAAAEAYEENTPFAWRVAGRAYEKAEGPR